MSTLHMCTVPSGRRSPVNRLLPVVSSTRELVRDWYEVVRVVVVTASLNHYHNYSKT